MFQHNIFNMQNYAIKKDGAEVLQNNLHITKVHKSQILLIIDNFTV